MGVKLPTFLCWKERVKALKEATDSPLGAARSNRGTIVSVVAPTTVTTCSKAETEFINSARTGPTRNVSSGTQLRVRASGASWWIWPRMVLWILLKVIASQCLVGFWRSRGVRYEGCAG